MAIASVPDELLRWPFTTTTAATYGVTPAALQGSQWRNVFREVWVHRDVADTREVRLAAVRLVLGTNGFLCGLTSAWIYGIEVQDRRGELVWAGYPTGSRCRTRAGMLTKEITVDQSDLRVLDGVAMTNELRTAFDCARWLSLVEAVVVADFLAHAGAVVPADLTAYALTHPGLRNNRRVAEVVNLMDGLSESAMETRLRLVLVLGGLPRPQAQVVVTDRNGKFVARVDLAYVDQRLIVEYDGALHWEQRRHDDRRRDALRALGWMVLVFSAEDYYTSPVATVTKVRQALRDLDAR
ncbi:MAG TPA: DUF559 domain-containing protein [Mycobacteriales bacterium]|nr:DUF559 domain-containing protein [Mycobacteriales bacterium]